MSFQEATSSREAALERLERSDVGGRNLQSHLAGMDRPNLLTGHVTNLCWLLGLDSQAVEDVALLISFDLGDRADGDAIGGNHVPSLLDL